MLKNFLFKKMLKNKGVPEEQIDKFLNMMEKNPELFKTIALEIQQKIKGGMEQNQASLEVMKKYQTELQKLV